MRFFNWVNGVTNRQETGADLSAQLTRLGVHPKAVFFTHLHPDHTGVPALGPQTEFIFGKAEARFLARAAVANHFSGKSKFSSIDFRPRLRWRLSGRVWMSLVTGPFGRSRYPVTPTMTSRI